MVVGTLRLVGGAEFPAPGIGNLSRQTGYMGQEMMNPPSVEGWHTGLEWINSGSIMRRTNFFADMVGDVDRIGVRYIIEDLKSRGELSPEEFVDRCLDLMGPLDVDPESQTGAGRPCGFTGAAGLGLGETGRVVDCRVSEMLQLIVALRDYQFA